MIQARILVEGRVQGVGYRASARRMARSLGLTGWARNLRDGRVEILVEGEESAVDRMVEWCRRGPAAARVTRVTVQKGQATNQYTGFHIRPTV